MAAAAATTGGTQKLHDCLFGEFICAEDQLRTLSQLTGLPHF